MCRCKGKTFALHFSAVHCTSDSTLMQLVHAKDVHVHCCYLCMQRMYMCIVVTCACKGCTWRYMCIVVTCACNVSNVCTSVFGREVLFALLDKYFTIRSAQCIGDIPRKILDFEVLQSRPKHLGCHNY